MIKTLSISLLFLLSFQVAIAQESFDDLMKHGIELHDKGEYKEAIETYQKALKINPESLLANYEMCYSYYAMKDYKKAVKYADKVLDMNMGYLVPTYIVKGSSLDEMGKTKESIKVFKQGIKKTGGDYLLSYNLALNYYKIGELDLAEESLAEAIKLNNSHASSHLMLAQIHDYYGNTFETILSIQYFLFLEPQSERSAVALEILESRFGGNVSTSSEQSNVINISVAGESNSEFHSEELIFSLTVASNYLDKEKSPDEIIIENTESLIGILSPSEDKKSKSIFQEFYVPFYQKLKADNQVPAFCMFIRELGSESASNWFLENPVYTDSFHEWRERKIK